jgi:hypothetical protein
MVTSVLVLGLSDKEKRVLNRGVLNEVRERWFAWWKQSKSAEDIAALCIADALSILIAGPSIRRMVARIAEQEATGLRKVRPQLLLIRGPNRFTWRFSVLALTLFLSVLGLTSRLALISLRVTPGVAAAVAFAVMAVGILLIILLEHRWIFAEMIRRRRTR